MFYGWKIVGTSYVTLFISVGFLFYSYPIFFGSLDQDFPGGRFAVSLGLAIMNISVGLMAPVLGRVVDTWSIRAVMLLGAGFMSAGFFLASQITAIWQLYALMGTFLGFGASMIGQLPSSTLVSNWFIRRRGMALGIATMGISTSGIFMGPLTTVLISWIGWRYTFLVFGFLSAGIVMPLVAKFVVNRPEDMGLYPDNKPWGDEEDGGNTNAESGKSAHHSFSHSTRQEFSTARTLRDRDFWGITLVIAMCFFSMGGTLIHIVEYTKDQGVTLIRASYVLTACATAGVIGKVLFGYIADFIDTRMALLLSMASQAAGMALLLFMEPTYSMLLTVGAVFGLGMGGIVPLWGSFIGEYFGRENFGRVMGLMSPCMLPIQVSGVPFAGYVFDQTGSYTLAFRVFLVMYAVAAVTLLVMVRRRVDSAGEYAA